MSINTLDTVTVLLTVAQPTHYAIPQTNNKPPGSLSHFEAFFKLPQAARYGAINRCEILHWIPYKLSFFTDFYLASHSPEEF